MPMHVGRHSQWTTPTSMGHFFSSFLANDNDWIQHSQFIIVRWLLQFPDPMTGLTMR